MSRSRKSSSPLDEQQHLGPGISEEGIIFGSTANGNPSEHMPIPNRYYEAVRAGAAVCSRHCRQQQVRAITQSVRQVDWHGGFTAAAGHALYTPATIPRILEPHRLRHRAHGHLIATFVLRPQGAGFKSKNSEPRGQRR